MQQGAALAKRIAKIEPGGNVGDGLIVADGHAQQLPTGADFGAAVNEMRKGLELAFSKFKKLLPDGCGKDRWRPNAIPQIRRSSGLGRPGRNGPPPFVFVCLGCVCLDPLHAFVARVACSNVGFAVLADACSSLTGAGKYDLNWRALLRKFPRKNIALPRKILDIYAGR